MAIGVGNFPGMYIADTGGNVIRHYDFNTGQLTVFAGNGVAGYVDGTTAQAEFHAPTGIGPVYEGIWFDINHGPHPYMYFSVNDSLNYVTRTVFFGYRPYNYTFLEQVYTSAGNHTQGYVDGPASSAQFSALGGNHASGATSYILDPPNHAVRTFVNSAVGTFAGNGTPGYVNGYRTSARFNHPTTATWDASGNMFVSDSGNHAIRKIDSSGNVTTFAGSGNPGFVNGQGGAARFSNPVSVVFNPADNYLYVTDTGNNSIRRIDASGNVTTYAGALQGGLVNGTLSQARFQCPMGVVFDSGFMYVADTMNNAIRRIDMSQGIVSTYIN
jgi:DNA-binding beta-propeller fold protein YncE